MASVPQPLARDVRREIGGLPGAARIAVIGMSIDEPCGVYDHAVLLARALEADGFSSSSHWLRRWPTSAREAHAEVAEWTARLPSEIEAARADVLLLHYSVFAFSHRGVPLLVGPVLAALRARRAPLICVMHEFAYPWHLGGVRGKVWAVTQRAVLARVMRDAAAVVVTDESRARWLRTRVWLPRRSVLLAPVFSNLPFAGAREEPPDPTPQAAGARADAQSAFARRATLGLFGYAHEGVAVEIVLDALGRLCEAGADVELVLLGAPGRDSPAGERWIVAARARDLERRLSFSGRLPAQRLAESLTRCAVLLFAERGGPTSRKTTLAAGLSSGRPVVSLDGNSTWRELTSEQASLVVAPDPGSLADAIARLLADPALREQQGRRGRDFAAKRMSVEHSARVVEQAIARSVGRPLP